MVSHIAWRTACVIKLFCLQCDSSSRVPSILAALDKQLGEVADAHLPPNGGCFPEQMWLKTLPASHPILNFIWNFIKANGYSLGLASRGIQAGLETRAERAQRGTSLEVRGGRSAAGRIIWTPLLEGNAKGRKDAKVSRNCKLY